MLWSVVYELLSIMETQYMITCTIHTFKLPAKSFLSLNSFIDPSQTKTIIGGPVLQHLCRNSKNMPGILPGNVLHGCCQCVNSFFISSVVTTPHLTLLATLYPVQLLMHTYIHETRGWHITQWAITRKNTELH